MLSIGQGLCYVGVRGFGAVSRGRVEMATDMLKIIQGIF